jgi:uncharacterized protein YjbJ (UPF0337 family)
LLPDAAGYAAVVRHAILRKVGNRMSGTDKIKNSIEDAEGKAKEALGSATGDKSTENEGKKDQSKSDLKDAGEKVKDAFGH